MEDSQLNPCGCCEAVVPPTPETIKNRPELSSIRYRVGTYSSFRQAMIEAIARRPELSNWTARTSDDYGIALLEMWAYLGDILTFYQERIANEAFLRTALLRESVLRLAALLDYKPSPGMAATAYLAFTLEKGKQVKVPSGLRVQSVPGQDEKPQKFETVEEIQATASLSQVRAFSVPTSVNPFTAKSPSGFLRPAGGKTAADVSPGDTLLFFQTGQVSDPTRGIEQKKVVSLETDADGYETLSWTPAMQKTLPTTARAFKLVRTLRILGHDAPRQYIETKTGASSTEPIKIELVKRGPSDYGVTIKVGTAFPLDSLYDDLKPGTRLLLHVKDGYLGVVTVKSVGDGQAHFAPFTGTVTQISLEGQNLPVNPIDRRKVVFYELAEPKIRFWGYEFAGKIAGGTETICVEAGTLTVKDIAAGRVMILADGSGTAELATVKSVTEAVYGGTKYLQIALKSALKNTYDAATTYLYGNVAQATHGETVADEALGSGDASTTFQSFALKKSPVTFVPKAGASSGAASTLKVYVDEVLWEEARSLYGYESDERVYTTTVDDEGEMTVRFGDGVTGARLPTGRDSVTATYRQGLGKDGNVKAEAIKTLLDRPVGLKGVINPIAAQGGADPETLKKARTNAPNTVRTFGRIVSLRDFEDAAREYSGVAKAKAACAWDGEDRVVHLTVAGDGGVQITGTAHANLVKDLNSRRDPNRKLVVEPSFKKVYVKAEAAIEVDSSYTAKTVQAAVVKALQSYFAFDNLDLGQPIHLSDVYRVIQNVKGVTAVDVDRLQYKNEPDRTSHGATSDAVQAHLPIYSTELAAIESTTDIAVGVGIKKL